MVRLLALVEGPTERNFVQRILAPHLGYHSVEFHSRVIGQPGHKGGVGPWQRAQREMVNLIRQEPGSVFTTMFDYYALPMGWPGKRETIERGLRAGDAITFIESEIERTVKSEVQNLGVI